jgi:Uma2 family endonuclease
VYGVIRRAAQGLDWLAREGMEAQRRVARVGEAARLGVQVSGECGGGPDGPPPALAQVRDPVVAQTDDVDLGRLVPVLPHRERGRRLLALIDKELRITSTSEQGRATIPNMSHRAPGEHMSYAKYLAQEATSDVRHEFLGGEVFAMAGGTPEHAALAAAVLMELGTVLRGKRCRVYTSGLRVRVLATDLTTELSTYPDVTVVCDQVETRPDDPDAVVNPVVLVEVLSDSTEAYDRGAKAAHYRRIPSLREYVLVSQHEPLIEVYRRNERGHWELVESRSGMQVELASLGVSLDVDVIYANPLT